MTISQNLLVPAGARLPLSRTHLRRERRARRAEAERNPVYECRGLEVDETARTVQLDGQPVNVTTKESDILLTLIRSPKRVFSMDQLFELVWKEESLAGRRAGPSWSISAIFARK